MTDEARSGHAAWTAHRLPRVSAAALVEIGVPALAAIVTAAATCVTLWFFEYEPDLDALGLLNPAYESLKTGHTTYPIYAYPTEMVVHPPTHYWILGEVMRITGMTGQAAALVPVGFWVMVAALLTASSRWRPAVKIGILFAIWIAVAGWAVPNFIRPDVDVAAAWIAGLVGLETGRIGGWRAWRLAVGSFAIALASMLHYPASLAAAGIVPYAAWAAYTLRDRRRLVAAAALVVPAGALLLAYALIFVLPHYADIKYVTSHQNAQGHGTFAAFTQVRDEYAFFLRIRWGGPVITTLMWPLLAWGIPAALVGPPLLACFRQTRLLGLATLPYLLTLLFYAREKTYYYYTPDVFVYFAAVAVGALLLLDRLAAHARRLRLRSIAVPVVALIVALAVGAAAKPALMRYGTFDSRGLHVDMEVARAAGAHLVPAQETLLTNDVALWYITGADRVYYPRDLDEALDVSHLNFRAYLSRFAAVAEKDYDTWTTKNAQHVNITSLLLDGDLHISGFYFGRSWEKRQPTMTRYLILTVDRRPLRGYAWDGKTVLRFAASRRREWSLVGAICAQGTPWISGTQWQTSIFLPGAAANTLTIARNFRIALVARPQRARTWRALEAEHCRRVFEQPLAVAGRDPVDAFLSDWRHSPRSRTTVEVPQADAADTNELYRPTQPVHVTATIDLTKVPGATPAQGSGILLTSPSRQFNSLFQIDLPNPGTPNAWIKVRLHVLSGLIGICSQDTTKQGCVGRITVAKGPRQTLYLRAGSAAPHLGLYVDNRGSFASQVEISSLQVVAAR